MGNQIRTAVLLTLMTLFLMVVGRIIGGTQGMMIALILAAGMNFFSYWYSDKIVLRMYNAREVSADSAPEIYDIVSSLAQRAELPMPKVYLIPGESPNAFATGRNPEHAVVAVTEGLLRIMDRDEVSGVLAHELAHVKNRDILIGSVVATMAGAIMMLASMARWSAIFGIGRSDEDEGGGFITLIVMSIIAPMAAMLIQMAVSRSREYLADATGARFAGTPNGLARALEKLNAYSRGGSLNANPATAHMFIVNPLSGRSFQNLFSTHPPIEQRVARLRGGGTAAPPTGYEPSNSEEDGLERQLRSGRDTWDRLSK